MKTGLFFGSFNPIHIGHMAIANYMVEYSDIDQIWFVVSPHNPLKKKSTLLDDYQRLDIVHQAIEGDERFYACDIEFRLPKPSYTIDTLLYLKEKYPTKEFVLIMGADNLCEFDKWKNPEQLVKITERYVYPRPGIDTSNIPFPENIRWIDAPIMEISSTFIRNAIKDNKDIRHFIPAKAREYISEMNFYKK